MSDGGPAQAADPPASPASPAAPPVPPPSRAAPRGLVATVRRELAVFLSHLSLVPTVAFVTAGLTLWAYDYYGGVRFFENVWAEVLRLDFDAAKAGSYFYWYGSAFVMLMLVPWAVMRLTNLVARDEDRVPSFGLGLGDWRFGLRCAGLFYGVMVVLLLVVVWTQDFRGKYPLYGDADRTLAMFLAYECAYALYFVAWEFFFRGFMTFSLEKTLGVWTVFVQMLPFLVMHFGKPDVEAMSSVFGGIALGWLALRTRSIWYGVFIHAATAVTLDCMVVALKVIEHRT